MANGLLDDADRHPDIGQRIDEEGPSRMGGGINPGVSVHGREVTYEASTSKATLRLRENERLVIKPPDREVGLHQPSDGAVQVYLTSMTPFGSLSSKIDSVTYPFHRPVIDVTNVKASDFIDAHPGTSGQREAKSVAFGIS